MCDSGDRRRACIFVHLDNLDIIVTATKPPFSWTKALRLYYIIRIRDAEMFRRRAPAAALRPSRRSALGSSGAGSGNRHTPTHGHAHAMSQQQRERKPRAAR